MKVFAAGDSGLRTTRAATTGTNLMNDNSIRLLAALPVPETTWEPVEPKTKPEHHPRGILRNLRGSTASGVHPIVVVEPPATTRTGTT
jgi:hypothetical protein